MKVVSTAYLLDPDLTTKRCNLKKSEKRKEGR